MCPQMTIIREKSESNDLDLIKLKNGLQAAATKIQVQRLPFCVHRDASAHASHYLRASWELGL